MTEDTYVFFILLASPVPDAQTKPFPAGKLLSRAISINLKITGMVGDEGDSSFPF